MRIERASGHYLGHIDPNKVERSLRHKLARHCRRRGGPTWTRQTVILTKDLIGITAQFLRSRAMVEGVVPAGTFLGRCDNFSA
jgi:hypothetical protein